MRRAAAALTLAVSLSAQAANPAPAPKRDPPRRGKAEPPPADAPPPDVRTLAGKISAVDRDQHQFTLTATDGPVTIRVDRNTMVFLESRQGTLASLAVGLPVRASVGGADNLAFWVEARPRGVLATAGGRGPPKEGGPGAEGTPPGASGAGGSGSDVTGTRGGSAPTPPPSAPAPGTPAGPGPVPGGTDAH